MKFVGCQIFGWVSGEKEPNQTIMGGKKEITLHHHHHLGLCHVFCLAALGLRV